MHGFDRPQTGLRHRRHHLTLAVSAAAALLCGLPGCANGERTADATTTTADAAMTTIVETAPLTLEERYVVGPSAARRLGYRIDWQYPSFGPRIRRIAVEGDSVFTLDDQNFVTRLRREEGDRVWRIPAANSPVEEILGITYVREDEKIYLTSGGDLLVLDADNGSPVAKQRLQKIAATAPIRQGQFLVYGSRDGQIAWHSFRQNSHWRAYQVSNSIRITPIVSDGYLVAVGNDGRVMCMTAREASQVWSFRALAPVVAAPAIGDGAVFVASLDQHLRAFDLTTRRSPLWDYLTESPLVDAPVLIRDRIYQSVASEGLVCLEAQPLDSPGGVVTWSAPEVTGNVITRRGFTLVAWDDDGKRLFLVDERDGSVIDSMVLPHVDALEATGVQEGNLYAWSSDGRIIRLVPRT